MASGIDKKWRILAVFLFFFLIGGIYNVPLIRHFNRAIPYIRFPVPGHEIQRMNMGDHLNLYYNFWLLKDNLAHFRNPFSDPYQFYYWGKKFFNPQIALFSFLFALFSPLGDVIAFNLVFLLSFVLAGGFAFLWLRRTGISFLPAVAGGVIVSLAPHRLSQMCGHINGLFYFSFPMLLYFAEGIARSPKKRYPILMGVTLVLMAWTEYHMFYYTVLFLVPYGLFLVWRIVEPEAASGERTYKDFLLLLEGTGVGMAVAVFAAQKGWPYHSAYPALVPVFALGICFFFNALAGIVAGVTWSEEKAARERIAVLFSPLILLIFYPVKFWIPIPQYGHFLFAVAVVLLGVNVVRFRKSLIGPSVDGSMVRRVIGRFLPVLPLIVLSGGIVVAIKKFVLGGTIAERGRRLAEVRYFSPHWKDLLGRTNYQGESMLYLGIVALVLMSLFVGVFVWRRSRRRRGETDGQPAFWLGSFLFFTFLSLGLSVPQVPLYAFFYKVIPYFKYPRVPGRMIFIAYAAMAFCVAWGLDRLPLKKNFWKWGLILAAVAGMGIDYFPLRPLGICLLERGPTVYNGMDREKMPPRTLLELPVWPGDSAWSTLYQYYVTRYRYPMVNGYSPVVSKDYVDEVFYGLYPLDVGEVSSKSRAMLHRLHVKYVTFHTDAYPYKICPFPSWMILKRLRVLPFLKEIRTSDDKFLFQVDQTALDRPIDSQMLEAIDSPVGVLWEAERSRHLIGKVVRDSEASAGKAVAVKMPGRRGMMMGNQHRFFPSGWYEGLVRLKLLEAGQSAPAEIVGAVLITGRHRKNTFLERKIRAGDLMAEGYADIRFIFRIPHAQKIECIVYSNGRVPLCLDYAFIAFKGRGEGPAVFQAEDLFHLAPVSPLPSGKGEGVCFTPDVLNDRSLWGPLHWLMPGRYRASFYLIRGGKGPTDQSVALLQVARGHQREILKELRVKQRDFKTPGNLQSFSLDFSIGRPSIMQFPVYYLGNGGLWVDRIKVARRPGP